MPKKPKFEKYPSTCNKCGKSFLGDKPGRKFCSSQCAGNAPSQVTKTCLYCGNEFQVPTCRDNKAHWCNRSCYDAYRQRFPEFQPGYKGKRSSNPMILNLQRPKEIINRSKNRKNCRHFGETYICPECNEPYIFMAPKQRSCQACAKTRRMRLNYQSKVKRRLANGEFVYGYTQKPCEECGDLFLPKKWNMKVCGECKVFKHGAGRKLFPSRPCEVCGWEHNINRHRIIPGNQGGGYTPENVIFLCPNHHIALHSGLAYIDKQRRYIWKE